ncbi:GNAT family N-acetyltransferase [Methanosarcina sp. Z-7115]|uniref:GNAT family N-acetyltransferase n=1 Tax=Methanosarcina baikalica TaxID=3073890 RepID=A0ABU2CZR6_9EURY|nr:GNAT family N-acetyltransferase [Methanosarcina sp. Z-7115]MDR7665082.1 GNAT family N-acetyltransferase [Methanosarcina sp. Z-7115]
MSLVTIDINDEKWDEFVFNHPYGNIFQTTSIYDVYKATKNYTPIKICSIDEVTGEINGILLGVIINELNAILGSDFLGSFSTHSVVHSGPLVSDNSFGTLSKLIVEYDKVAENKSLYNEIWNLFDRGSSFNNLDNYIYEGHLNFLINLDQSEDELWREIHKARKKNINRATKGGVIVEEINNKKMIPIFYKLLKETYDNVKIPLADITLFESAFEQLVPKNMAKFFLARHEDQYIGARAVLTYKNFVHDWYAGASNNALSLYPNDFLVWHILKWGIENNYKVFDFGGAGKPDVEYGPREFKRRFGGELVNYGRYRLTYSPLKKKFTNFGFKIYQKFT